jgi:hypothetical protein
LTDGGTIGNFFEVGIGGGDSGEPAFLWSDDGDSIPQADELTIFGINTHGLGGGTIPPSPFFGSVHGGTVISPYVPFINSIVPEPSSFMLLVIGLMGLAWNRRGW